MAKYEKEGHAGEGMKRYLYIYRSFCLPQIHCVRGGAWTVLLWDAVR